jgi:hypothetical protein
MSVRGRLGRTCARHIISTVLPSGLPLSIVIHRISRPARLSIHTFAALSVTDVEAVRHLPDTGRTALLPPPKNEELKSKYSRYAICRRIYHRSALYYLIGNLKNFEVLSIFYFYSQNNLENISHKDGFKTNSVHEAIRL